MTTENEKTPAAEPTGGPTDEQPTDEQPTVTQPAAEEPAPVTSAAQAPAETAVRTVDLRRPSWLTRTVAIAGGVAAATFVIGGAAGYALGHNTADDGRDGPMRIGRDAPGFGHDGNGFRGGPGFDQQGPAGPNGPQQAPGTAG